MDLQKQLMEQKMKVDFNTYDLSIKELISMVNDKLINIAPEYQRQFRWDKERQSSLIESIFLSVSAAGWSVEAIFVVLFADALRCFEFARLFDVLFVNPLALSLISPLLSREKSATILSAAPCPTP